MKISDILNKLKNRDFNLSVDDKITINDSALELLSYDDNEIKSRPELLDTLANIVEIGNITYEHCDSDIIPLDNGVYDLLVEKLKRIDYNRYHPGAIP